MDDQAFGPRLKFKPVWQAREDAFNRRTDTDRANAITKLKSDAITAIHKIDKALGRSSIYYTPPTGVERRAARPSGLPIEHSRHRGAILGIR